MSATLTQGEIVIAALLGLTDAANERDSGWVAYPDLIGHTVFLGRWLAIMDAAAQEAIRQGKTIKQAQDALAVAMGAQREKVTK